MPQTATEEIVYPSSDGKPMADTPIHTEAIILLKQALDDYYQFTPDVYVAANMLWYWEEGVPSACCSPDVMVVPGVGRADRRTFMSWMEPREAPAVVFEIASASSWQADLNEKLGTYEGLGVVEYFVFDPEAIYLRPSLQGFRLQGGYYSPLRAGGDGSLESIEMGLRVVPEGRMLRLIDRKTKESILTRAERAERSASGQEAERQRAEEQQMRAERAEQLVAEQAAENARLKAELEALKKGPRG